MKTRRVRVVGLVIGVSLIVVLGLIDLDRMPAPGWDEGWTMAVARNWVKRGHYGQLLNGQPVPPGLSAAFPTVASVALSFKLFGVGVWQGRLATVIWTGLALAVWWLVAKRASDRSTALIALGVLLLTQADPALHPIMTGRQVLAEPLMMALLLIGYLSLTNALGTRRARSIIWLLAAIGAWSVALLSKAQPLPFWALSLLVPLVWLLIRRQWQVGMWLVLALGGSILSMWWLPGLIERVTQQTISGQMLTGLTEVTALVLLPQVRVLALVLVTQIALPTVIGLVYATYRQARNWRAPVEDWGGAVLRAMLLIFSGSWFAWYLFLSRGSVRYALPAVWVGSLFVAQLVSAILSDFKARRGAKTIGGGRPTLRGVSGVLFIGLLAAMAWSNGRWVIAAVNESLLGDAPVQEAVTFLNTQTRPGALIETYNSELFVLLERPYHFPPDQTDVALIRDVTRANFGAAIDLSPADEALLNYDALAADPEYVVVGPANELWRRLYNAALHNNQLRSVYANRMYEVYERIR
jgi:hypothetical protein